jgi:uncharacterized repeat protein (TIGR01451 family)
MVLQYAVIAPATALAINPDTFELDGNVEASPAPGDDWNQVYNGTDGAFETLFLEDPINGNGDKFFTGGDTKDIADITSWLWTNTSQPQDKNDISNAFAAAYRDGGDLVVYVGLDRYASNGAGQVGFWFLQSDFGLNANGTFSGKHVVGDVLVQIDFENGGTRPVARVYEWNGSGITLKEVSGSCDTAISKDICAIAATSPTTPVWIFDDKGTPGASNDIPAGGMVESGVNLTDLGLDDGCFASFVAETRSSPSESSTLSDFAFGNFALCNKPDITTRVRQGGQNISTADTLGTINLGESVYDWAKLSGSTGTVTGDVKFYVCRDASSLPDCSSGGDQVGAKVPLIGEEADSATFTPTQTGYYCFRAEYIPAEGAKYFAAEHTNQTTECFRVIPAEIKIVKTRDAATVSAGDQIGFTITVSNIGEGKAYGVSATDTLPTGFTWSIESKSPADSNWAIADGVLTYSAASLASGAESSVHIVSGTDAADCGPVTNEASVSTTNDGSDTDSASLEILCPDVVVHKTPNDGSVNRSEIATFSIVAENIGTGTAKDVVVTDDLPADLDWSTSSAGCTVTGLVGAQVLTCNVGPLAPGAKSATFTVSADTDLAVCEAINNFAVVSASNEAKTDNNTDPGSITVLCANIDIDKVADDDTVNAGEQIGFTITVTNNGTGVAYGVSVTDTLPAGFTWTESPDVAGWTIAGGTLTFSADSMDPGASSSIHIVAGTTAEQCKVVSNTAEVTTTNDGGDKATDTTTILCPDIKVTKTPDGGSVSAGDTATFSIKVENIGDGLAKNVIVSDTLPIGLDWSTTDTGCSITAGILTCNAGDLAKGESKTFTVSADTSLAACTVIDNTATATAANEAAADSGNNSDDGDIAVNCPDITVEKTPDAGAVSAGEKASFSMTVTNLGPGLARDVMLSDTLPGGLDWAVTDSDGTCSITGGVLSCDFGDLAEKATASVTVEAVTTPEVCYPLMNTATVSAANEAPNATAPNTDDGLVTVNCPDIKVTKAAAKDLIDAGDTASFTVTVENIGKGTAYGVTLDDPLPGGVTWVITSNDGTCAIVDGDLECAFGDMAPTAKASVTVAGVTDAEDCKVLTNIATGFATNEPSDRETRANNVGQDEITVQCPNLVIEKTPDGGKINAGDEASFGIKVTNKGPAIARDVEITDQLPSGIAWAVKDGSDGTCTITDGLLECEFGDLEAGESVTVTVSGSTDFESCKLIENTATVSGSNEPVENQGDNSDDGDIDCQKPLIGIVKSELSPVVNAGEQIGFEVTVANTGPGAAYNVYIEDVLPTDPGTFWSIAAGSDPGFSIDGTKISWGPATLAAGDSVTVILTSFTTPATCGVVDNEATLTYQGGSGDDDASVTVLCPDLVVDKTPDDGVVTAGDEAAFKMTITNVGDGLAKNPTLTDTLPVGIDWSEDSMYCSIESGVLSCVFPDMAKDDSYSVTISGLTTNEACTVIPNLAKVEADNEANTDNNTDTGQITVDCPDVSITKKAMPGTVLVGSTVVFEIVATNDGPGTAYGVVITDELPGDLAWAANSEDCTITEGVLTCQVGDLEEGSTFTVRISAPTSKEDLEACSSPLVFDNTAKVSATNEDPDRTDDNEASATATVECAEIGLVKIAGDAADGATLRVATPGNVTFTYVATNTGSTDLTDFGLVDDRATPANAADDVAVTACTIDGNPVDMKTVVLEPGESMTCTVTLSVTFGVWTNTAVVTGHPVLDKESTVTDSDNAVVQVPEPVRTPKVTPPPTSTIDGTDSTTGTTGLLLVLAALAGLMLAAGYMRPARAAAQRRNRKG